MPSSVNEVVFIGVWGGNQECFCKNVIEISKMIYVYKGFAHMFSVELYSRKCNLA